MKKTIITIFLLVTIKSHAVFVNHKGLGEVVLIPYYSVNNQLDTYVSLTNTTGEPKAIKINIREGLNGYAVLSYNIYLDAYDTWVYALVSGQSSVASYTDQDTARSVTNDSSCAPFLNKTTGQELLPFALIDGPDDLSRSREGFIEILEMGVLTGDFKAAVAMNDQGIPENCALLADAWQDGGEWAENPQSQLSEPTGGLMVTTELINVSQGINYSIPVTALSDFYADGEIPHVSPGDISLSLDAAAPIADMETDDRSYTFSFDRGEDAVSAVLMNSNMYSYASLDTAIGAETEMVFSQPTRRFYVNAGLTENRMPYSNSIANSVIDIYGCNYAQGSESEYQYIPLHGTIIFSPLLCGSVSVIAYQAEDQLSTSPIITGSNNYYSLSKLRRRYNSWLDNQVQFDFFIPNYYSTQNNKIVGNRNNEGFLYDIYGLPIIGLTLYKYGNANATNGLLAQYGASSPMKKIKTIISQ